MPSARRRFCDNHPKVKALVVTDGGGKHNEISLCDECTPSHLRP